MCVAGCKSCSANRFIVSPTSRGHVILNLLFLLLVECYAFRFALHSKPAADKKHIAEHQNGIYRASL